MKRFALLAAALPMVVGLSAPAQAATALTVDFADAVMSVQCAGVPVVLQVSGTAPEVRFEATVTLHDPEGWRDDPELAPDPTVISGSVPAGGATSTKTVKPEVCSGETAGLWRADVKVDYFDSADNLIETKTASDTATLRFPASYTGLGRSSLTRTLVISVNVEGPGGVEPCPFCHVRLQVRAGGRWKTVKDAITSSHGTARTGVKPKARARYRAVTPAEGVEKSVSEIFRRR